MSKMIALFFLVAAWTVADAAISEIEVTSASACEVCRCVAGDNPNDVVMCEDKADYHVKVSGLPTFVNRLKVVGAASVTFARGSVTAVKPSVFHVDVENVAGDVNFNVKSFMIFGSGSGIKLTIKSIRKQVQVSGGFLSAPSGGSFTLGVVEVGNFVLNGNAFEVVDNVSFAGVKDLQLQPYAFKTKAPLKGLDFKAEFVDCFIRTLPTDTFPPADNITFDRCRIQDMERNIFPQTQTRQISFISTSVDRLHGQAFPDQSLVQRLVFDGCHLTSFSERAICCGVSRLEFRNCDVASIAEQAVDAFAADIVIVNNTFNTLSKRAMVFSSWSSIDILNNTFSFVEGEAFDGLSNTEDTNPANFTFSANRIGSANVNALKLELSPSTKLTVGSNVYLKDCHCGLADELQMLTGDGRGWAALVRNTSFCSVPSTLTKCFPASARVLVGTYYGLLCGDADGQDRPCRTSELDHAWSVFQDKIEVDSNRGILLIVLLFVLASCLVVGILTLFRWIVWTIRNRGKGDDEEEWNFTKVEERAAGVPSPLPRDDDPRHHSLHYESLPLTTTEVLLESAPSSPQNNKASSSGENPESTPCHASTSRSTTCSSSNQAGAVSIPDVVAKDPPAVAGAVAEEVEGTVGHKPQPTFYDEMLCLLKEKLDDPDNYASVVDSTSKESQHLLYQDPLDVTRNE